MLNVDRLYDKLLIVTCKIAVYISAKNVEGRRKTELLLIFSEKLIEPPSLFCYTCTRYRSMIP